MSDSASPRPRRQAAAAPVADRSQIERKLADDLHTHQIELQMQNQELTRAKNELEQSRARYFELFDFAPVAYLTCNARGSIQALNLAATELLHVDRQRALQTPLTAYLEESSKVRFRHHLDSVFQNPEKHTQELTLAAKAAQATRHVHLVSRLMRGELSVEPLCLTALIDITARKQAEQEAERLTHILEQRVAQRTAELEESNRDLEAFIYSISHDLRAPLRNMAGFAAIIAEDYAGRIPAEVTSHVQRILHGNEKMLRLVDDLLRFSRLGRTPLAVVPTDLNQLIEEARAELAAEAHGREIVWRTSPLPVAACDRALMRQVFVNLIANALKYSRPRRPAIITIGTEVRQAQPMIFVKDNGVGFDMRYYDKLFGVFQRLHGPAEFEGNGVGLAMIARILHRHGGAAHAEARVDQGATFWFTFSGLSESLPR
ncbi:ATP-binding protein [Opitutus sp. ER46]|uniref:sensor histidine kinase n=1 Tax=Opitutus sp. ER46 TaxID=2161864 RepID=UPI0011B22DC7|nr:ATP-binding protein [Opitutus sp. ER46]